MRRENRYPEVLTFWNKLHDDIKNVNLQYLREKSNNGMGTNVTAKYVNKQNEALVRS